MPGERAGVKRVVTYLDACVLLRAVGPVYTDDAVIRLGQDIEAAGFVDRCELRLLSVAGFHTHHPPDRP